MILFETERLRIKSLESTDKKYFTELFTDEKVLQLIPQKAFTESQITNRFHRNLDLEFNHLKHRKCTCGIFEKGNPDMIGLSLFLINEDNENELGYRFRADYWGKGYGKETTKGMLEYYFKAVEVEKVMADVNIKNVASVKILNTLMKPVKDFYNERDQCTDRRFELKKNNWPQ